MCAASEIEEDSDGKLGAGDAGGMNSDQEAFGTGMIHPASLPKVSIA